MSDKPAKNNATARSTVLLPDIRMPVFCPFNVLFTAFPVMAVELLNFVYSTVELSNSYGELSNSYGML